MEPERVCLSRSQESWRTKCLTRISSTLAIIGSSDSAGKAKGSIPPMFAELILDITYRFYSIGNSRNSHEFVVKI